MTCIGLKSVSIMSLTYQLNHKHNPNAALKAFAFAGLIRQSVVVTSRHSLHGDR